MVLLIRKKYIDEILNYKIGGFIVILTGIRYCGKSTILKQAYEALKKQNNPKEKIKFIDFKERGFDYEKNAKYLQELLDSANEDYKNNTVLFMDNIEYVNNWGHILHYSTKYQYNLRIYIAPVDSDYANENIRCITYLHKIPIYPFSFNEFLEFNKINCSDKLELLDDTQLFEEYLKYGGLPEVLESDDTEYKLQIIRWAYDNTLYPRIGKLYFRDFASSLMKYLIETVGEKFSLKIFQKFVNEDSCGSFNMFNLSYELLEHYCCILLDTSLIKRCGNHVENNFFKIRDYKHYTVDHSFHVLCFNHHPKSKEILESMVYMEFKRRKFRIFNGIADGEERVTFIHKNKEDICIQVEKTISDENYRKKTFNKLKRIKNAKKYIITTDKTDYSQKDIKHVNIVDFLKDQQMITGIGD